MGAVPDPRQPEHLLAALPRVRADRGRSPQPSTAVAPRLAGVGRMNDWWNNPAIGDVEKAERLLDEALEWRTDAPTPNRHAFWGTDPSGYCGCEDCNAPEENDDE